VTRSDQRRIYTPDLRIERLEEDADDFERWVERHERDWADFRNLVLGRFDGLNKMIIGLLGGIAVSSILLLVNIVITLAGSEGTPTP
jgi:hypothetical protein